MRIRRSLIANRLKMYVGKNTIDYTIPHKYMLMFAYRSGSTGTFFGNNRLQLIFKWLKYKWLKLA